MAAFEDRAYAMTALSVVVVVLKVLVNKGLIARDDVIRALLDEAVIKALAAEEDQAAGGQSTANANRQSAEMLKFITDQL
jgi:hypothetical protein